MLKNFYSVKELSKLSSEEILELSSFDGQGTTYYYSEIEKITNESDEEYSIKFRDGEEIFTKNAELIEEIRIGKARFDLITKSLEHVQKEEDEHTEFYEKVKSDILEEMQNVHTQVQTNRTNFDTAIKQNRDVLDNAISGIQNDIEKSIKVMESKISKSSEALDKKVKKLNDVDTEKFSELMKQMETITQAFNTLMA